MKISKCNFFSKEIQYLGHILSATGIWPLPSKTHVVQHMQPPTMPKQVWTFLGLVGCYRKFIKRFTKITKPLTMLTHQQVKFEWTPTHHTAFLNLKEAIIQAPILHYPDPNKKVHYLYRCIWWCMQSTTLTGRWWKRISCCILVTYIHRDSKKMEHIQTGCLWSLLHNN